MYSLGQKLKRASCPPDERRDTKWKFTEITMTVKPVETSEKISRL